MDTEKTLKVAHRFLLSKGANPNAIDSHRCTAVQYAAKRGRLELVRVLHAKGGDLMVKPFDAG
jgi:ankyrin repeat protein